jgi:hypothetical protein
MNVVMGVAVAIFGVLELVSIASEIVGWRKESAVVRWRRILLHLGVWVVIVGGFFAIVYSGPLRPVHEWMR